MLQLVETKAWPLYPALASEAGLLTSLTYSVGDERKRQARSPYSPQDFVAAGFSTGLLAVWRCRSRSSQEEGEEELGVKATKPRLRADVVGAAAKPWILGMFESRERETGRDHNEGEVEEEAGKEARKEDGGKHGEGREVEEKGKGESADEKSRRGGEEGEGGGGEEQRREDIVDRLLDGVDEFGFPIDLQQTDAWVDPDLLLLPDNEPRPKNKSSGVGQSSGVGLDPGGRSEKGVRHNEDRGRGGRKAGDGGRERDRDRNRGGSGGKGGGERGEERDVVDGQRMDWELVSSRRTEGVVSGLCILPRREGRGEKVERKRGKERGTEASTDPLLVVGNAAGYMSVFEQVLLRDLSPLLLSM